MNIYHGLFLVTYFYILYGAIVDGDYTKGSSIKAFILFAIALAHGVFRGLGNGDDLKYLLMLQGSTVGSAMLFICGGLSGIFGILTVWIFRLNNPNGRKSKKTERATGPQ